MATNATGRNVRVGFVEEVTLGTTPASALQLLNVTSATHAPQFQTLASDDIGLGEVPDAVRVGADATITLEGEWSYGVLDAFGFIGVAFADWATNVLKVGSTRKSFTVEFQHLDIGKYFAYTGCVVQSLVLKGAQRGKLTFTLTLVPTSIPTASASSSVGTGSATAALTNTKFSPATSIQLAQEGGSGSLLTTGLTAFSLEFSRAIVTEPQMGSLNNSDVDGDIFEAKGSFSAYLPNTTMYDKLIGDTATSLSLTIGGSAAKKYAIVLTTVKLLSGGPDAAAKAKAIIQTYNFQSFYDATNTSMKITRTP